MNATEYQDGYKVFEAISRMAKEGIQGGIVSTTLVNVSREIRGSVVGFGFGNEYGDDAER